MHNAEQTACPPCHVTGIVLEDHVRKHPASQLSISNIVCARQRGLSSKHETYLPQALPELCNYHYSTIPCSKACQCCKPRANNGRAASSNLGKDFGSLQMDLSLFGGTSKMVVFLSGFHLKPPKGYHQKKTHPNGSLLLPYQTKAIHLAYASLFWRNRGDAGG